MIIPAYSKIPIATVKKECDARKRRGRGLDIGRLRHSQPETDLAALKKEITPSRAMLWQMGFGAGKSSSNGPRGSHSLYSVRTAEIVSTDTKSNVSVAASEECHRFATDFATDR